MNRIASIDIFRAITMFLMIVVNDFFTVKNVPKWLLHTEMNEDGMGFSDVIFPIFLVIVGMSIPFAMANRIKKGDQTRQLLSHIAERTFALLCMGFFLVNLENVKAADIPFAKSWLSILLITSFFCIWNFYPKDFKFKIPMQVLGALGLIVFLYLVPTDNIKPYWWGILGLIGWSYLWASLAYLWTKNNLKRISFIVVLFFALSLFNILGVFNFLNGIKSYVWIVESGALPFLCMLGVLSSVLYQKVRHYDLTLIILGILFIGLGLLVRPYGGISKIFATPAWVLITGGIAYCVYAILYRVVDVIGIKSFYAIIEPAGTATLTCYLLPYYWYAAKNLIGFKFPSEWMVYPLGLVFCILTSLLIIQFTRLLVSIGIKLKI